MRISFFFHFFKLLSACQNSHFEIVQWLIKKQNANINDTDYQNSAPLHYAAAGGNEDIIYYLLENDAKITSDSYGNTPLHVVSVSFTFIQCISSSLGC